MMTKNKTDSTVQTDAFKFLLVDLIDIQRPLIMLADKVDWQGFDTLLEATFSQNKGRPSISTRMMVGLHYLKYIYNLSDVQVLECWLENPYWQHFTGGTFFEHRLPINESSMTYWRKRLEKVGAEKMLQESIAIGLRTNVIKPVELKRVNVDTTVQEKEIRYPTDSRSYHRAMEHLVTEANRYNIQLRQTYVRKSKTLLAQIGGYSKAKQFNRLKRATRQLKTLLGRVHRDFLRKAPDVIKEACADLLEITERLLAQTKTSKNKVYSIHAPEVECIMKGKLAKPYEFGVKVGLVTTSKTNWIIGAQSFPGNPYDGHTLTSALTQTTALTGIEPDQVFCDQGYKGHGHEGKSKIYLVNKRGKKPKGILGKCYKRRAAIEPIIGHIKSECRLQRNKLRGSLGDAMNILFAAAAHNMKKLMRSFLYYCRFLELLFTCYNRINLQSCSA